MKYDVFQIDCSADLAARRQPVYSFPRPIETQSKVSNNKPRAGTWYVPAAGLNPAVDDPFRPRDNAWVFVRQGDNVAVPLFSYTIDNDWSQVSLFLMQLSWHAALELTSKRLKPMHLVAVVGGPYVSSDPTKWLIFANFCIRVED